MFDRITFDPKVLGGRACIRGLRIPVSLLVSQIAHGASDDEILKDYPDLEADDLRQAMEYAALTSSQGCGPCSRGRRMKSLDSLMPTREEVLGRKVDLVLADAVKPRLRPMILAEAVHATRL